MKLQRPRLFRQWKICDEIHTCDIKLITDIRNMTIKSEVFAEGDSEGLDVNVGSTIVCAY